VVIPPDRAREARVANLDSIQRAYFRLYRCRPVTPGNLTDVAMGVDQARDDCQAGYIDNSGARWNSYGGSRADRKNGSAPHDERAVLDGR
jgi:hypothetical protein